MSSAPTHVAIADAAPLVVPTPSLVVRAEQSTLGAGLKELWEYRELLFFLTWRDIKVRYQQTALGAAWAVLQPLTTMLIFTVLFGRLAKLPSDGIPYPVFTLAALLPWQLFAFALSQSSNSLVANAHLITKVYFPRTVIPLSAVLAGLVDFLITFGLLLVVMAWYRIVPSAAILFVPVLTALAAGAALGIGLWLSALSVQYRDVRYVLPFLTQAWFFVTPVAYPSSMLPEPYRTLSGLNPLAGIAEGFRWAMLGSGVFPGPQLAVSAVTVVLGLVGGIAYFHRMETTFADTV